MICRLCEDHIPGRDIAIHRQTCNRSTVRMTPCTATDCGHGKFSHRGHIGECQAPCCPCTWYESGDNI